MVHIYLQHAALGSRASATPRSNRNGLCGVVVIDSKTVPQAVSYNTCPLKMACFPKNWKHHFGVDISSTNLSFLRKTQPRKFNHVLKAFQTNLAAIWPWLKSQLWHMQQNLGSDKSLQVNGQALNVGSALNKSNKFDFWGCSKSFLCLKHSLPC